MAGLPACNLRGFRAEDDPTRLAPGLITCSSSRRFPMRSALRLDAPVMFPPGRRRLSTNPSSTGCDTSLNTIGMSRVRRCSMRAR